MANTTTNQTTPSPVSSNSSNNQNITNHTTQNPVSVPSPSETAPSPASVPSPSEMPESSPSPFKNDSIIIAPSTATKTWTPSPQVPSPQSVLVDHGSVVPMIAMLVFALALGVIFTFRKHLKRITFRQKAYHRFDEPVPQQELVERASNDEESDNGQLSETDINEMI